jgi:deoxyadenosine/deoxycytidine kinase
MSSVSYPTQLSLSNVTSAHTKFTTINNNLIVSIDGNIGSGKSTLIENIFKRYKGKKNIVKVREPVSIWETVIDENGRNILANFYADQSKYAFVFQSLTLSTRSEGLQSALNDNKNSVIITERNLNTDKYVFAQMLHDSGHIDSINMQVYTHMYNALINLCKTSKVIYVKTDPEICHQRVGLRLRNGEENIPLDYLTSCCNYHTNLIDAYEKENVPVLTINGNYNNVDNVDMFEIIYADIEKFINPVDN